MNAPRNRKATLLFGWHQEREDFGDASSGYIDTGPITGSNGTITN
jgi:hypothetical protein